MCMCAYLSECVAGTWIYVCGCVCVCPALHGHLPLYGVAQLVAFSLTDEYGGEGATLSEGRSSESKANVKRW